MIIYKIQQNGQATDFQISRKCPEGWKSIIGDKIPDDVSIYHEQRYIDSKALENQKSSIIALVKEAEYHFSPASRWPDTEGKWKDYINDLWAIYDSNTIQKIPDKPFK